MKKRILASSLALLLVLASCGGSDIEENNHAEMTRAPETTSSPGPVDPPADYGDYDFTILTSVSEDDSVHTIFEDERNGDILNEKILERNKAVEKELNIFISEFESADPLAELTKETLTESTGFDAVVVTASTAAPLLSSALLLDLTSVEEFDPAAPYFDASSIRDLSLGGSVYTVTGDLINSSVGATSVVLCNNALLKKIDFESEFSATPKELAERGEWTFDVMLRACALAESLAEDEDNAPVYLGFAADVTASYPLAVGSLATVFEKDGDDLPVFSAAETKFTDILKRIATLSPSESEHEYSDLLGSCYNTDVKPKEALFTVSTLEEAAKLNKNGLCFSVLPMPKYDSLQSTYASYVSLADTCLAAVPVATSDASRSVTVLSAISEHAGATSKATYLTRYKKTCNHAGFELLSLILESRKYDLGDLFGWGEFEVLICDTINDPDLVTSFPEAAGIRGLAAEKAMDIVLKRLLGENYKEETK